MIRSVAVAGGGIAAGAACLTLAAGGIRVTWIAPPHSAADRPGESLAAAAGPLLDTIGLGDLLGDPAHRPVAASFSAWGSAALLERSAIAQPGGMGHVIDRGRFEAAMAERVGNRAGIAFAAGQVKAVARRAGGWQVTTDAGQRIEADILVDATGRASRIGRGQTALRRGDRLVALYAFLEQVDPEVEPTPATLVEAVATGWWYATLLADGRLAINHYSDPDLLPRGIGRDPAAWRALAGETRYISRWIDSAGFALSEAPQATSAGTAWLAQPAGPDWIAVGDAAAAFDPLSSHGMTTALWTGIEAGRAVRQALVGDRSGLDRYAGRVLAGVDRYLADRQRIYAREARFAGEPFWRRRHSIDRRTQPDPDRASAGRANPMEA